MNMMKNLGRRRSGVTLIEMLVVIAIIGVLASLTFPALSLAVAKSRLTVCIRNQYQSAFALLRYDEQFGNIPGWISPLTSSSNTIACSWTIPLLPFLGRSDAYDMLLNGLATTPTLSLPNTPRIEVLICPANRPAKDAESALHYTCNVGASGTNSADGVFVNGVRGACPAMSLTNVAEADGTATTLAFAEKTSLGMVPYAWTFWTGTNTAPLVATFGSGTTAPAVFGASPSIPFFPVVNGTGSSTPASVHAGGAVVAYCDGHTAFLSDKIQPYEYGQLLTPWSRWQNNANKTNSVAMQPWLLKDGQPYLLDEKVLK